jgi:hypothetical protein
MTRTFRREHSGEQWPLGRSCQPDSRPPSRAATKVAASTHSGGSGNPNSENNNARSPLEDHERDAAKDDRGRSDVGRRNAEGVRQDGERSENEAEFHLDGRVIAAAASGGGALLIRYAAGRPYSTMYISDQVGGS